MTSLLMVTGLRKSYAGRQLLDIPSFALQRGMTYVLQGENGSGKTTLLRILAGLTLADAGTMVFDGVVYDLAARRAMLAPRMVYVHQHSYVFHTSVAANVEYGLKLQGVGRLERARRVREQMEWAGIDYLADVPPHRLSGGEKQRVALARARALNPEVLLLDEPTSNLDDGAREQVAELIRHMRDANNCVLVATHDQDLMRLEEAVRLHLDRGRITSG